jgi:hyperosmotically inducible periplasmic protein
MRLLQFTALPVRVVGASLVCSVLAFAGPANGQDQNATPTNTDNSSLNKAHATTSDQQSETTSDRLLTQKIRKSVVADKSLSVYGHNVKIITKDGLVTLKGPVHSDEEKQKIGDKAAQAAGGADKITNQLTVKQ